MQRNHLPLLVSVTSVSSFSWQELHSKHLFLTSKLLTSSVFSLTLKTLPWMKNKEIFLGEDTGCWDLNSIDLFPRNLSTFVFGIPCLYVIDFICQAEFTPRFLGCISLCLGLYIVLYGNRNKMKWSHHIIILLGIDSKEIMRKLWRRMCIKLFVLGLLIIKFRHKLNAPQWEID